MSPKAGYMIKESMRRCLLLGLFGLFLIACDPLPHAEKNLKPFSLSVPTSTVHSGSVLILATTTSTQDSGLLDVLLPIFQEETGYLVKTVAVGTGQALRMGMEGNADVLLVHAPDSELDFMREGYGKDRAFVMHNDFVLLGPENDPAGIQYAQDAAGAFQAIAHAGAVFLSRGDGSGTYARELQLWKQAGIDPRNQPWYLESGQGMGATLMIAEQKLAYTLCDRGTYLAYRGNLSLKILFENDPTLLNVYHVITVNPQRWPMVNYTGALAFLNYLTRPSTQAIIGSFGVEQFGEPLFIPDAGKNEAEFGLP
ncbi:substrate-binding domain-containing protein [Anaerolinea thermolimosa]|uniref:substrate-binding domain-containing protein n=1 Tax=Anaerolinea thermolimosa TaxID=229919 RepID=UPI00191C84A8|nr:substrate-binding domain-containing protein [Anaerolinea thermolimosa]